MLRDIRASPIQRDYETGRPFPELGEKSWPEGKHFFPASEENVHKIFSSIRTYRSILYKEGYKCNPLIGS